jgi:hypothetical protein
VLWTGTTAACLSHDTALAAYDVCHINPDRTHVTVPTARRVRRSGGDFYVIHRQDLDDEQNWSVAADPDGDGLMHRQWRPRVPASASLDDRARRGELTAAEADTLERGLQARDDGR